MKYLSILAFTLIVSAANAQKVKIKDDVVSVDGVEYVVYKRANMGNEGSVRGLSSEREEVYMTWLNYSDPNRVSKSNPEGLVRWVEINFLDFGIKCEVASNTHKAMLKLLYENNVYVDGVLNRENAERFVQKYGTRFSQNRPGSVTININN